MDACFQGTPSEDRHFTGISAQRQKNIATASGRSDEGAAGSIDALAGLGEQQGGVGFGQ